MKILFINGTNNIGGGELSLFSIAEYFKNYCTVVSFAEGDFPFLLKRNGINSIILKNAKYLLSIKREDGIRGVLLKIKYLILTIFEIRNLIKQYDVIYCNSQKAILLGLLSSFFIKKKFIIHVRDIMDNPNISIFHKKIFKLLVNLKKPIVIANSYSTKQALINIGVTKEIKVVYNGIKVPILQNNNLQNNVSMNKNKKFVVAMFSRISHWKGQEYFIKAINILKKRSEFLYIEFWIVGDALMTDKDKEYKNYIVELIEEYNLKDKIKLFGFVRNSLELMQNIDVLVLPSIYPEPFGRVIIEAMLLKKVIIATNHGGPTEIIKHNEDGVLVNPNLNTLPDDIANYIIKLFNDKDYYNFLSSNAYYKAISKFSEKKMLQDIESIIKSLQ